MQSIKTFRTEMLDHGLDISSAKASILTSLGDLISSKLTLATVKSDLPSTMAFAPASLH